MKSGYRKTAGNTCSGGVDHSDVTLTCPFTSRMLYFRNLIVMLILGLLGYTVLSFKPELYENIKHLFTEKLAFASRNSPDSNQKDNHHLSMSNKDGIFYD